MENFSVMSRSRSQGTEVKMVTGDVFCVSVAKMMTTILTRHLLIREKCIFTDYDYNESVFYLIYFVK